MSPQAAHVWAPPPPEQARPLWQVNAVAPDAPPAPVLAGSQQGWLAAPQSLVHIETPPSPPLLQPRLAPQAAAPKPPLQHGSPAPPHFSQALFPAPPAFWTQPRSVWHWPWPAQQGWPLPPHVSHIPPVVVVVPGPPPAPVVVVVAPTQAEPDWQMAPTQHAAPFAPQFMHVLLFPEPAQARPVLHDAVPPQQDWPSPPQAVHMPVAPTPASPPKSQASPVPQLVPPKPQQACPLAPHASHIPFVQRAPEAVHAMVENPPLPGPPPAPLPPPAPVAPQQI